MKIAVVPVSTPLLVQMFRFPEGTRITAAGMNERGDVVLTVEHEDLRDQPEGVIGTALPVLETTNELVRDARFVEWGQR